MNVEVKSKETQMAEAEGFASKQEEETVKVEEGNGKAKKEEMGEEEKKNEGGEGVVETSSPLVKKSSSFKDETKFLSNLNDSQRKALTELKMKVKCAILQNNLFKNDEEQQKEKDKSVQEEGKKKYKPIEVGEDKKKPAQEGTEKEKQPAQVEDNKENPAQEIEDEEKPAHGGDEEKAVEPAQGVEKMEEEKVEKEKHVQEGEEDQKPDVVIEENVAWEVDKDISLWGVPLFPKKSEEESTNVLLLKFLRAKEFKVIDAFQMLKSILQWRKENKIDSILDEEFDPNLNSVAYMNGVDHEGHPICYNIYGVFQNDELYQKTFGTEEKCKQFLRWRFQLMEKGIQRLDFKPGGISALLQINDLKNSPGPSKKDLRVATKQAVELLQNNYPEFVTRNIFINVPFWYYAFNAVLTPFLTQRTTSKFVFARPAKVTETLLKYIPIMEIPVQYGGFKRDNDFEFSAEDGGASELMVKAGSTETIEIPVPEVGTKAIWDLTVLGWEVNYKEEFVPTDEGSYTVIIQKGKKLGTNEGPVRNSFKNNEPGKIFLVIESSKKKRALYRYKTKNESSSGETYP